MLHPRVIPVLLVHDKGLVKSVKFKDHKYVGDPLNAVRIFNEKEVDELVVLDIDATVDGDIPNFKMINDLASECRMPLCYGGGICTAEQAKHILELGVEKVAFGALFFEQPEVISDLAQQVGRQSVVVVLDVKKRMFSGYECVIRNGKKRTKIDPIEAAVKAEELGAGEIIINSVDRDGCMNGYDLDLVAKIRKNISVPVTVLGGAGSSSDIRSLIQQEGIIGAAAGSFFVFKGKYRAVLISYPTSKEKYDLFVSIENKH